MSGHDFIEKWSQIRQLDIIAEECFVLHSNFSTECPQRLCGLVLPAKEVMRNLGVYVSSDLSWRNHCVGVPQRVAKVANYILCAVQYGCLEIYRKAFVAFFRPLLEFCTQVCSPSVKKAIEMIEKVKPPLRFIPKYFPIARSYLWTFEQASTCA